MDNPYNYGLSICDITWFHVGMTVHLNSKHRCEGEADRQLWKQKAQAVWVGSLKQVCL